MYTERILNILAMASKWLWRARLHICIQKKSKYIVVKWPQNIKKTLDFSCFFHDFTGGAPGHQKNLTPQRPRPPLRGKDIIRGIARVQGTMSIHLHSLKIRPPWGGEDAEKI